MMSDDHDDDVDIDYEDDDEKDDGDIVTSSVQDGDSWSLFGLERPM